MREVSKLLGGLPFISRTFEGGFKDNPFILDLDANLYIGPADQMSRDEHSVIEVIFHFLNQTGRAVEPFRVLLRNRIALLNAFAAFDTARAEANNDEFRILIFGTYDGEPLESVKDDDLPAGPCGMSINSVKRRFYQQCRRLDRNFEQRQLSAEDVDVERRFVDPDDT